MVEQVGLTLVVFSLTIAFWVILHLHAKLRHEIRTCQQERDALVYLEGGGEVPLLVTNIDVSQDLIGSKALRDQLF